MSEIIEIENRAVAAVAQAGPMGSALQALQAGATVEQLQGLLTLQKDWEANEARKAYVAAMAEFKKNPPEIFKRKEVAFGDTRYSHATIGDVTSLTVAGLAAHGFSHRWDTKQADGRIEVSCILTHNLGHSESTTLEASPDSSGKKNAIQQVASTVTYLQRYTLLAACGLATKDMEDDDGAGAAQAVEIPPELLQAARDAAMGGWKALGAWIKERTDAEVKALEPESDNLKAAAKAADKAKA
jgi:hypothetical protein